MHARCRIVVVLSLLAMACAGGEDDLDSADTLESRTADGCEYVIAPNFAHLLAHRAYVKSHAVGFFHLFAYHARGSNDRIGLTPIRATILYKTGPGRWSASPEKCATRADGGVYATADAGPHDPVRDTHPSVGCQKAPTATAGAGKIITVGTDNRTYNLSIPANYDQNHPYPLVFAFHGMGSSGMQAERYFGLQQAAGNEAIVVYPDAVPSTRAWGITGDAANLDLVFFDALRDELTSHLCVDETRIFAAGHSMGGFFANTVGCARGSILRGIAAVGGGGPFITCDNGRVAAMLIAAKDDPQVAASQGASSRDWWLRASHCEASTRAVGPSSCVAYNDCEPGYPVKWCLEPSGGHAWPSFAGTAIWDFFDKL